MAADEPPEIVASAGPLDAVVVLLREFLHRSGALRVVAVVAGEPGEGAGGRRLRAPAPDEIDVGGRTIALAHGAELEPEPPPLPDVRQLRPVRGRRRQRRDHRAARRGRRISPTRCATSPPCSAVATWPWPSSRRATRTRRWPSPPAPAASDPIVLAIGEEEFEMEPGLAGAAVSGPRRPVPCDYDADPARFGLARAVLGRHAAAPDVHAAVARRFADESLAPVLDVGCGEGELARHLPEGTWTGVDASATMAARAGGLVARRHGPAVRGRLVRRRRAALRAVPPRGPGSRAGRGAPRPAAGRARAVAAPSRDDSPELAELLPARALTFDAELAPGLLADHFDAVEVERWDLPLVRLPDRGRRARLPRRQGRRRGRGRATARAR